MNHAAPLLTLIFLVVLFALAWPLGHFLQLLMDGRLAARAAWMRRTESLVLRACGADPGEDMDWRAYARGVVLLHVAGVIGVYVLQRLQHRLPLNPAGQGPVEPTSAFNTAVSFATNTDWQGYAGETTMSHLTQMLALGVQNFLSAATGIAVAVVLVRGFVRRGAHGVGNLWLDLVRATLWLLLPLCLVYALFLVSEGVVQNFRAPVEARLLEPLVYQTAQTDALGQPLADAAGKVRMDTVRTSVQRIAQGPVASQEAVKMLGTNGGGFFNANSAHPYENPTPLSNLVQMLSIFLLPAALVCMFGRMVGDHRQGFAVLGAMTLLFLLALSVMVWSEGQDNPLLVAAGAQSGVGNLEGKEWRFGVLGSAFFATVTTAASCGAVNAMHGSFMPLGGGIALLLMQLGEVVFGGVGSGLYGMLLFCILAVFLAGLMIGRTPEYLGKKIGAFEVKMVSIAILVTPMLVLGGTAVAVLTEAGRAGIANPGAQGFSEVLYAFSSAANNNGSAFAGLSANTAFYNIALAIAMWFGRFTVIVPVLAIAGSLAAKPRLQAGAGTMPTHGPLFVLLLAGTVLIVGALTYIPALALGPLVEHLQLSGAAR